MKLYIYDTKTMEVVAIARGKNNDECEAKAVVGYADTDQFLWTYSPAFGASDGLIETADPVIL